MAPPEKLKTEEQLEKLKSKRSTIRGGVTRTISKVEVILSETELTSKDTENLKEYLEILIDKHNSVKDLDKEIDTFITDKDEYDKEVNACEDYNEKIVSYKFKIKNCIEKYEKKSVVNNAVSNFENVVSNRTNNISQSVNIKLPKLSIESFAGDPSLWFEFFNTFETSIDSNPSLTKVEKFTYLKSLLSGPALNCVSGFCLSGENYDASIKLLKERFGRKDLMISSHMNKLLNLEPVKYSSNIFGLRKLYDQLEICVRNLNALEVASGSYGHLLNHIIFKLLPQDLTVEFHRKRKSKENVEVTELIEFIKDEIECRETALMINTTKGYQSAEPNTRSQPFVKNRNNKFNITKSSAAAFNTSVKIFCIFCKCKDHGSKECQKLSDDEKRNVLKREGRCYRCFLRSHLSSKCKSKIEPCEICQKTNHNKLFCFSKTKEQDESKSEVVETEAIVSTSQCKIAKPKHNVLLQTCSVVAQSKYKSKIIRLLIDSGSQRSFISTDLARELKLPIIRKECLTIYSFGGKHEEREFEIHCVKLKNKKNPLYNIEVEVVATDCIAGTTVQGPSKEFVEMFINKRGWEVADSACPDEKINILLGVEYFWQIQDGPAVEVEKELFAVPTIFGYTLMGKAQNKDMNMKINSFFVSSEENETFDIESFWKLQSIGISDKNESLSLADLDTINTFNDNLKYVNSRYETGLLWKKNKTELANNFEVAKRRFLVLENKLKDKGWLLSEYKDIIKEQLEKGIIEECKFIENESDCYYMPHRPVVRENKTTAKVRIVFDASSKDKNAKSLNDCLFSGPNLNPNLLDIILKFRIHKVAFSADIEKAFHQIQITDRDRDFLRFLWFDDSQNSSGFKIFRMNRVTFGVTSSPFILSATIKQHIKNYYKESPEVVNMLNNYLYVDDLYYGANTEDKALSLTTTAINILSKAGMNLRKFKTNSKSLRKLWKDEGIQNEDNEIKEGPLKALGITWDAEEDYLKLDVQQILLEYEKQNITKRRILSTVAKLFDPLGLISPFVMKIKILLQELWVLGVDWDTKLPEEFCKKFKEWCCEAKVLLKLQIPRRYFLESNDLESTNLQLFVFCDASLKGYGAVAYFYNPDLCLTSFVLSKGRISPLKGLTLPRLELMAALIAARLASYIKRVFEISAKDIVCYSDSQIVLHWIKGSANKWKPFVANRVREIQDLVSPSQWKYCKGSENPADLVSRGTTASYLINNEIWYHGPTWLRLGNVHDDLPVNLNSEKEKEIQDEKRKTVVCTATCEEPKFELFSRFSSWIKLKRLTAWCLRFINNAKSPRAKSAGFLTVQELNKAENIILKCVQCHEFKEEIKLLRKKNDLSSSNKLLPLNPFIDKEGLLRVGGRLRNSNLSENNKHQIILPKSHNVTDLIVKYFHEKHFHSGTLLTISSIRQKFWIINCRDVTRKFIRNCMKCFRNRANTESQIMADLPCVRVMPNRVFSKIGIDFAGPFMIKHRRGRGVKPHKSYVCLYICLSTKAIHLEIVSDLTTEAFIASLKRFVARRGKPQEIWSDRGTNFVGANRELREIVNQVNRDEAFQNFLTEENIRWNFNPPSAPHFGGIWEAGIKQMKGHLMRTIGVQLLTHEEFFTLITQIEACLNSRPIVDVSNDANDLTPLTPGHFIIGTALTAIPEPDVTNERVSPLKRWKLIQQLFQSFWKRWSSEYLSQLQVRTKWLKNKPNLDIGHLVLIKDDNLPPLKWRLGRIIELYPGADGKVRVVKLKTLNGELKRPIHKLSLLPFMEKDA